MVCWWQVKTSLGEGAERSMVTSDGDVCAALSWAEGEGLDLNVFLDVVSLSCPRLELHSHFFGDKLLRLKRRGTFFSRERLCMGLLTDVFLRMFCPLCVLAVGSHDIKSVEMRKLEIDVRFSSPKGNLCKKKNRAPRYGSTPQECSSLFSFLQELITCCSWKYVQVLFCSWPSGALLI